MAWLSETKICYNVSVPGFHVFYNPSKHGSHRGGIMLLIKEKLLEYVKCVDMYSEGQIWVTLAFIVPYKLGGVYIPPDDSPYFQQADIGSMESHVLESGNTIVMGDLNARVAVPKLSNSDNVPYVYSGVVDNIVNARGRTLLRMCNNNDMVIANHLLHNGRQLGGDLSFKRGNTWVSEIDTCLAKQECIDQILEVHTHQGMRGSDHAPLSVTVAILTATITNIDMLMKRSEMLGQVYTQANDNQNLKQTPSHRKLNLEQLTRTLQEIEPPTINNHEDVEHAVDAGFCTINNAALSCRTDTPNTIWDQTRPRWARILESQDLKSIWKSLNWRGTFDDPAESQPPDNAFKLHFEQLLSQEANTTGNMVNTDTAPYIPVLDDPFVYKELENAVKCHYYNHKLFWCNDIMASLDFISLSQK